MKVIKRGKKPEDKSYKVTCDYCQTIFIFKRKEAEWHGDQRDGDYLSIRCPICKNNVTVGA